MSENLQITLDNPALRARLRGERTKSSYMRRPVARQMPRLITDFTTTSYSNTALPVYRSIVQKQGSLVSDFTLINVRAAKAVSKQPQSLAGVRTLATRLQPETVTQTKAVSKENVRKGYLNKPRIALVTLAIVMIGFGGYIMFSGWRANVIAKVQAAKLTAQANAGNGANNSDAPSTIKPSAKAIASYYVAPNLIRYLNIPKLGVHVRVFSVGVTKSGALDTPKNIYDTAWYNESAQPGQPGATLIDGHISSWTSHGVFYGIKTLVAGDTLQIVRGDNQTFNYKVVKTQIYSEKDVDMAAALTPIIAGKPGLNLISCTGDVIPGTSEFNERIVVFAVQV